MNLQRSAWQFAAIALLVAGTAAIATPLSAAAQKLSEHCVFLQERIARMQGDIVALQNLVNHQNVFMKYTPKAEQSVDAAINEAYRRYYTLGTWFDAETRSIYIVVTRDFMMSYAQSVGASKAAVQRALTRNEGLRTKVQYGGVVESLRAKVTNWQEDFVRECGGPVAPSPPPPPGGCLLGVCP